MQCKKKQQRGMVGKLPPIAPLANPYVPFQLEDPPKYNPGKALVRGTLYPGLDLPFKGKVNQHEKPNTPMTQLQVLAFTIQELVLYLDTHRNDKEALEQYRTLQKMYHDATNEYAMCHSPLSHRQITKGDYRWLDDPWPWEYCANREG